MGSGPNHDQRIAWIDQDFQVWLKRIKAQKEINGQPVGNLGEITKEIMQSKLIRDLERELVGQIAKSIEPGKMKFRMDNKNVFGDTD